MYLRENPPERPSEVHVREVGVAARRPVEHVCFKTYLTPSIIQIVWFGCVALVIFCAILGFALKASTKTMEPIHVFQYLALILALIPIRVSLEMVSVTFDIRSELMRIRAKL